MTQLDAKDGLPPKVPSVTQGLALYFFRHMRDDVRGLIALVLAVSSAVFAVIHDPAFCVLTGVFAIALFIVNFRHSSKRREQ